MFSALFLAFWKLFLPVGVFAYLLVGLLLDGGKLEPFGSRKELDARLKAYRKEGKKQKRKEGNVALQKWLKFGGGFYGTAAFYTYVYIEVAEIFAFVVKILNPANWSFNIGFDLLVNFIINSIRNFIDALIWFTYWSLGQNRYIVLAILAAYLGYLVGAKLANTHMAQGIGHVQLWRWWEEQRANRQKRKSEAAEAE